MGFELPEGGDEFDLLRFAGFKFGTCAVEACGELCAFRLKACLFCGEGGLFGFDLRFTAGEFFGLGCAGGEVCPGSFEGGFALGERAGFLL